MDNISKNCNQKSTIQSNYISCIKIDGVPILPPLLSEKDREEMRHYRNLAIEVQKKLSLIKTQYLSDSTISETDVMDENMTSESSNDSFFTDASVENSTIKFGSCCTDVINMLEDKVSDKPVDLEKNLTNPAIHDVPLSYESKYISEKDDAEKKSPLRQLSHTVESFEKVFSEDILKSLACVDNECDKNISKIDNDKKNNNIESSDDNYVTANETEVPEIDKTPCRLIRSNSFILENPSPLLIAQIEKENLKSKRKTWDTKCFTNNQTKTSTKVESEESLKSKESDISMIAKKLPVRRRSSDEFKRRSPDIKTKRKGWDLANARQKWSSIENDIGTYKFKNHKKNNSLPTSPNIRMFISKIDKVEKTDTPKNEVINEPIKLNMQPSKDVQIKMENFLITTNTQPNYDLNLNNINAQSNLSPENIKTTFNKQNLELKMSEAKTLEAKLASDVANFKTPDKRVPKKPVIMSTPRKYTPDTQRRILKGCVTPIRTNREIFNIPTHEYSVKRAKSAPRPVYISQKKTDVVLRKPNFPLFNLESPYYFVSEKDGDVSKNKNIILPEKDDLKVLYNNENKYDSHRSISVASSKNEFNLPTSSNEELQEMFNKMQEVQKQQMAELMKRQKEEQEMFLKKFAEQQSLLLTKLTKVYSSPESQKCEPEYNDQILKNSETLLTECRKILDNTSCDNATSQTLYALNSSSDTLADSNLTLRTDSATDQSLDEITIKYMTSPCNEYHVVTSAEFRRSLSDDSLETAAHVTNSFYNGDKMVAQIEKNFTVCVDQRNNGTEKRQNNCSRALFKATTEQIRAASIICAAAKGYLVRRLLKSDRVQNLIQTIKDTLLCAMDLHHETVENIQPSDIELHRRLIQQVTAACVSFHDMFFKLTIKEQMAVISQDRERLKEKLLRPVSSRSLSVSSTTQKVLERKLRRSLMESLNVVKRDSSVELTSSSSRSSFSRSCHSTEGRTRARSVGTSDSVQYKKTSSMQDSTMRRSMGYSANKKPWR